MQELAITAAGPSIPMPILSLQEVSKDYLTDGQPVHALSGLSLNVERSEFVALVGRSGCGKSTLLNLAGAMDFPTSGKVLVDGVSTSSAIAILTNFPAARCSVSPLHARSSIHRVSCWPTNPRAISIPPRAM